MNKLITIGKPESREYAEWYANYIRQVPYDDLLHGMVDSFNNILPVLKYLEAEDLSYRYAEGKWSIKQIWQHVIDAERIFCYRALRYSRQDNTVLQPFDENLYAETALADERDWINILQEYASVRDSTISFFNSLNPGMIGREGIAGTSVMTVRALGYVIIGHEIHHMNVIRERYMDKSYRLPEVKPA